MISPLGFTMTPALSARREELGSEREGEEDENALKRKALFKKRILNMRWIAQQKMKDICVCIYQQHIERQRGNAPSK